MTESSSSNISQDATPETFMEREQDWRNGAIVYQVLVDRFSPSARLDEKRDLYAAPKVLRDWSEVPQPGPYLPAAKLSSHEIDFWGGDLQSLNNRLDYVQQLGADVLYLNPIHMAYTNHKYDALDFKKISPEFGDRSDFIRLASDVHARGMKLVLDGVFNHMGRHSAIFQDALSNPDSAWRDWFAIGTTGTRVVHAYGRAIRTCRNLISTTRQCAPISTKLPTRLCAAIYGMVLMAGASIQHLSWGIHICMT